MKYRVEVDLIATVFSDFEKIAIGMLECANASNKQWANQLITTTGAMQWPNSCMEIAAIAGSKVLT
jgi:hypothetical protein